MAAYADTFSVDRGRAQKIVSAVTAAGTQDFSIPEHPGGGEFSGVFYATGTVTALTSALQISLDGGATFTDYIASASFISNTTPMKAIPASGTTPLVSGAIYRINNTAVTGAITIWLALN